MEGAARTNAPALARFARQVRECMGQVPRYHCDLDFFNLEADASLQTMTEHLLVAQLTALADKTVGGPQDGHAIGTLSYTTACYQRCTKFLRGSTLTSDVGIARKEFVAQLRRTTAKFVRIILQHPALFPDPKIPTGNTTAARLQVAKLLVELLRKGSSSFWSGVADIEVREAEGRITDDLLSMLVAELSVASADPDYAAAAAAADPTEVQAIAVEWRREIFSPVFAVLVSDAAMDGKKFDAFVSHIPLLQRMAAQPGLVELIVQTPRWNPAGAVRNARDLQTKTLLGMYLSWSVCPEASKSPGMDHFSAVTTMRYNPADVKATQAQLRQGLNAYHRSLHDIVLRLLQCKAARESVMEWLAQAILLSTTRTQDRHFDSQRGIRAPEDSTLSTDGFMVNLGVVMVQLCKAYTSASPLKFDKIEDSYLLREAAHTTDPNVLPPRVLIESPPLVDPKLVEGGGGGGGGGRRSPRTVAAEAAKQAASFLPKPNFTTESLFMTLACLHVGLIPTVRLYLQGFLSRNTMYTHLHQRIRRMTGQPHYSGAMQRQDEQIFSSMHRDFLCLETQLHDPNFTVPMLEFYVFVCAWLLHLADPEDRGLPLPKEVPVTFGSVPEYVVEDVAEFFTFISNVVPEHLEMLRAEQVATVAKFYAVFLGNMTYMKQAHLRAKFVEVLWRFTPEQRDSKPSPFFQVFVTDPISEHSMVPALVSYFVDIEDDDVYARSYRRHQVAEIMKNLWAAPPHRKALEKVGASDPFRRYLMLLINDALDQLDTGRGHIAKWVELKAKIADAGFQALPQEERSETLSDLQRQEGQAKGQFEFGMSSVAALSFYSTTITAPFSEPELASRLSGMLNFNVAEMMARREGAAKDGMSDADIKKHGLDSTLLLEAMGRVYVHVAFGLSSWKQDKQLKPASIATQKAARLASISKPAGASGFLRSMATDERSFSPDVFAKVAAILSGRQPELGQAFQAVVEVAEAVGDSERAQMEDLGEIPDNYLDPITAELMKDPVELPSGSVMDRSVLKQHLLSSPTDPFNRAPLVLEDVVPAEDLRKEIEAWVASKRK